MCDGTISQSGSGTLPYNSTACTRQRCASYGSQKGKCLLTEVNALMRSLSLVEGGAVAYVQTTGSCPSVYNFGTESTILTWVRAQKD